MSSTKSGNTGTNAGLMPDAFQLELNGLLNAPSGASTVSMYSLLPNTALIRSDASFMLT